MNTTTCEIIYLDGLTPLEVEEKRNNDPHYQAMQKADHIIEYIEGKVRKYAWGFDKKAGIYRDYSKKEYESLKAAGKTCTDF